MAYSSLSMRSMLSGGYSSNLDTAGFPSPFLDMASLEMPEDIQSALRWSEFIFMSNGTYRQAMERIIAYFLTDIEVGAVGDEIGDDEKQKWTDLLTNTLSIYEVTQDANRDIMCYGNSFLSLVLPFTRFIVCPKCFSRWLFREVASNPIFGFRFASFEFHAICPRCNYRGKMQVKDETDKRADNLSIKRWSPHEIKLLHDPFTDNVAYLWDIPAEYKDLVRRGNPFHLERVNLRVLEAIKTNKLFRFADDVIFHSKEPTLSGIQNRGWGLPRILSNFRQIWYVQVLHRYNEAIALDYVIPFRLVTPASRGGAKGQATDPLLNMNMGDAMQQIRLMLRRRRRDPAGWHTLGFPVEYQVLGGDAKNLAPFELLNQGIETMLNAAGTPVELYKGTLQLQAAPVSMRLFEATWHYMVHQSNKRLRWIVSRVAECLAWEPVEARHRRVTHADDMQKAMAALQLAMGSKASMTSALKTLGMDYKDEQRNLAEEARFAQEQQAKVQEEMDQSAFAQQIATGGGQAGVPMGPGQPGAPAGQASAAPVPIDPATGAPVAGPVTAMLSSNSMPQTPEDMLAAANSIAQQLLGLPESQKDSELRALHQKHEVMHALVRAQLDQIRGQARSQGGSQLLAQTYGG